MSGITTGGGETIQLSFGPVANAITSHLCNLQGLASTTASSDNYNSSYSYSYSYNNNGNDDIIDSNINSLPLCDPYITHSVQNEIYVPRVLFIDGKNCFSPWPAENTTGAYDDNNNTNTNTNNTNTNTNNWNGQVEIHHRIPVLNQHQNQHHPNNDTKKNVTPSSFNNNEYDNGNGNYNNNNTMLFADTNVATYNANQLNTSQRDALHNFHTLASSSSGSVSGSGGSNVHSRYHASRYKQVSSQFIHTRYNNNDTNDNSGNGRYMTWDDEEEEEEEEEEDDEYTKQRRMQLEHQRWNQQEIETQYEINHAWDAFFTASQGQGERTMAGARAGTLVDANEQSRSNTMPCITEDKEQDMEEKETTSKTKNPLHHLGWMNYFMPPHPNTNMYTSPLPFDLITQQQQQQHQYQQNVNDKTTQSVLYSHQYGKYPSSSTSSSTLMDGITTEWRDEVSDKIRKWMEECDTLRGIQLMIDNDMSLFGGIASSILEELNDECKSAGKFSILVEDGDSFYSPFHTNVDSDNSSSSSSSSSPSSYWHSESKVVQSFRSQLNHGLNLHGINEFSNLVLPLSLNQCWKTLGRNNNNGQRNDKTLFEASAVGALALEAVTLPYRLTKESSSSTSTTKTTSKGPRSKIGILNGYFIGSEQSDDNDAYPTADRLSYHEFLSSMRPSNSHTILELSASMNTGNNTNLQSLLLQGTSIERKRLEQQKAMNRNSMSYYRRGRGKDIDPGLWMEDNGPNGGVMCPLSPVSTTSTRRSMHQHFSLMTAFRPTSANLASESVSVYTTMMMEGMGIRYRPQSSVGTTVRQSLNDLTGSQSYAAGSYWKSIFNGNSESIPILSVLGNTTRVHSHLNTTAKNISQALSRKYQGYLTRDSMIGIVPEKEDCTDAMEQCLDLRDTYEPSMLFDDEHEGVFFEDNED